MHPYNKNSDHLLYAIILENNVILLDLKPLQLIRLKFIVKYIQ